MATPFDDELAGPPQPGMPWPPPDWVGPAPMPMQAVGPAMPGQEQQAPPLEWPPPDWAAVGAPSFPSMQQEPKKPTEVPVADMTPEEKAGQQQKVEVAKQPPVQPVAAVQQKPEPVDPYLQGIDQSAADQGAAIDQKTDAQMMENDARAAGYLSASFEQKQRLEKAEAAYDAVAIDAAKKTEQLWAEAEALGKAKPDPARLWNDASLPQRAAGMIALFLGGMQSAFTGRNGAMDALQQMLDRDMRAQEAELQNRGQALTMKRGLLADGLAAGKDRFAAQTQMAMTYWQNQITAVDAEMLKYQNPQIQADGMMLKAQIGEKQNELKQNYYQQTFQNDLAVRQQQFHEWATRQQLAGRPGAGGGAGTPAEGDPNRPPGFDPELGVVGITNEDGTAVNARSKKDQEILSDKKIALEGMYSITDQVKDKYNEIGPAAWDNWVITSDGKAWYDSMMEQLRPQLAVFYGQGALGNEEAERFGKIIMSPTGKSPMVGKRFEESLDAFTTGTLGYFNGQLRNRTNIKNTKEQVVYDPKTGQYYLRPKTAKSGEGVLPRNDAFPIDAGTDRVEGYLEGTSPGFIYLTDQGGNIAFVDPRSPQIAEDLKTGRLFPPSPEQMEEYNNRQEQERLAEEERKKNAEQVGKGTAPKIGQRR